MHFLDLKGLYVFWTTGLTTVFSDDPIELTDDLYNQKWQQEDSNNYNKLPYSQNIGGN